MSEDRIKLTDKDLEVNRDSMGCKIPVDTDYIKKNWYENHLKMRGTVSLSLARGRKSGDYYINVEVFSVSRMGVIKQAWVACKLGDIKYNVMLTAGACAEALCQDFGDPIDPDAVAHEAEAAYNELRQNPKALAVFSKCQE